MPPSRKSLLLDFLLDLTPTIGCLVLLVVILTLLEKCHST